MSYFLQWLSFIFCFVNPQCVILTWRYYSKKPQSIQFTTSFFCKFQRKRERSDVTKQAPFRTHRVGGRGSFSLLEWSQKSWLALMTTVSTILSVLPTYNIISPLFTHRKYTWTKSPNIINVMLNLIIFLMWKKNDQTKKFHFHEFGFFFVGARVTLKPPAW